VAMPRWSEGRVALLGDAASAVSLIAGKRATLALAGAVLLADALADRPGATSEALAAYEARLRPWAEAAQRTARRNASLFTPATRFQLLVREAVLRLATWPVLAPLIKRLLNRGGSGCKSERRFDCPITRRRPAPPFL
jgi:2-polyprenyl-6-methoxyphenol hydroxylase-like FAD-dependent oxidoreductase